MTPEQFHELFLKATNSRSGWIWAHGYCFRYAYCFLKLVGGQGISYVTQRQDGHCFIKFQNRYYDSENFEGQMKWKHLQSYLHRVQDRKVIKHRNLNGLTKKWFSPEDHRECEKIINNINQLISNNSF